MKTHASSIQTFAILRVGLLFSWAPFPPIWRKASLAKFSTSQTQPPRKPHMPEAGDVSL